MIATENSFVIGYSVLDVAGIQEGQLKKYDNGGTDDDKLIGKGGVPDPRVPMQAGF